MTKNNDSKQEIINAASKLFQLYGYHGVGLNEIIKESGTAKGSLYHYFPNGKEELAIAAIDFTKDEVAKKFQKITEGIEDPISAVQAYINNIADEYGLESVVGVRIGTIAGETSLINDSIRLACMSALEYWQSLFTRKFVDAGYSEEQAEALSLNINMLIEGGIIFSLTKQSGEPLKKIAIQIPTLVGKR